MGVKRRGKLQGGRGQGTLEQEKLPIFGMIQRGGAVVIWLLFTNVIFYMARYWPYGYGHYKTQASSVFRMEE